MKDTNGKNLGNNLTRRKTIATITLEIDPIAPSALDKLDAWLRSVLWESTLPLPDSVQSSSELPSYEIHRTKGRIHLNDGSVKLLQGVREIFEFIDHPGNSTASKAVAEGKANLAKGKLVFIGRGLDDKMFTLFEKSLKAVLQ